MTIESMNTATETVNDYLATKNPKSPMGYIRVLNTFYNKSIDADERRVALRMINCYKRVDRDQKFEVFVGQKAANINKKPELLSRDQLIKFRRDFEKLEDSRSEK